MMWIRYLRRMFAVSILVASMTSTATANGDRRPHEARKAHNARHVIWIGDFNNFDDAIALMLVAKDPRYRIDLVVVEESFNTVAHGANMVYNILEWLGNLDTEVIRGAYHAVDEVALGANGASAIGTEARDANSVPGQPDYQLPNSADVATGTWNLERRNVMGIGLYGQFVPGPLHDNGSTLYNTDHLIPRATQPDYHFQGNRGRADGAGQKVEVVLGIRTEVARQEMISRLRDRFNSAVRGDRCGRGH